MSPKIIAMIHKKMVIENGHFTDAEAGGIVGDMEFLMIDPVNLIYTATLGGLVEVFKITPDGKVELIGVEL